MKLKYITLLIITGSVLFTACKKADLFLPPQNSIDLAGAFSTPDRIEQSSVGMYDALQNPEFFGGRVLIYADQRGIDVSPNTYFGQMGFFSTLTSSDGIVANAWQGGYRTIYQANLFLKYFTPNASLVSPSKADQYIGEAKYIRSLCYFYLVNLWAQPYNFTSDASQPGVPLVLTAADDPFASSNNIPKSTVKQVYDQMETDLLDAEAKLPLTYTDPFNKVARATKGAARALLMRLYLYKGDNVNANKYADLIINSNLYGLNADPQTTFRSPYTSPESISSVAMSGADNPNTNNALGQHYSPSARGDISVSIDYINLMDTTKDLRYKNLIQNSGGNFWTTKYAAGTTDYVPITRYAEVLLTKAEALAKIATGVDATAVTLLNEIRTRSLAPSVAPTSKQELLDAIVKERRIELAFEGQGEFEFNRNKLDIPAHYTVPVIAFGSDYRVLPIPKYDTDKNPNLVQNHGY